MKKHGKWHTASSFLCRLWDSYRRVSILIRHSLGKEIDAPWDEREQFLHLCFFQNAQALARSEVLLSCQVFVASFAPVAFLTYHPSLIFHFILVCTKLAPWVLVTRFLDSLSNPLWTYKLVHIILGDLKFSLQFSSSHKL